MKVISRLQLLGVCFETLLSIVVGAVLDRYSLL